MNDTYEERTGGIIHPPAECSWYWKRLCKVKEAFKLECDEDAAWCWRGAEYNVHKANAWHFHDKAKVSWYKLV